MELDEEVEVRPKGEDDAYTILLDPSRIREDFGWEPKTPLEEGVRNAIDYYRENGVTQTFTHLKVEEMETSTQKSGRAALPRIRVARAASRPCAE